MAAILDRPNLGLRLEIGTLEGVYGLHETLLESQKSVVENLDTFGETYILKYFLRRHFATLR